MPIFKYSNKYITYQYGTTKYRIAPYPEKIFISHLKQVNC